MSGFSADWLALREPADHAARAESVAVVLHKHFDGRGALRIADLGAGAGSNLRYTYQFLPRQQHWTLIDHDPALTDAARDTLAAWADEVEPAAGPGLRLVKDGRRIEIVFHQADLAAELSAAIPPETDLVTSAALFDLTSEQFLSALTDLITARRLPLYAALIYNGHDRFTPPDKLDGKMLGAFHRHMEGDKGFGPALGPNAAPRLTQLLKDHGFVIASGDSPWELDVSDTLMHALAEGVARAIRETGVIEEDEIDAWLDRRLDQGGWRVGHTDLFAARPA